MQVFVYGVIEEQLLQLGRLQEQGGALGQQCLLLFVGDPSAVGAGAVGQGVCLGQPAVDLREDVCKERFATAGRAGKQDLLHGGRKLGCLAVGQAIDGHRVMVFSLQLDPGPEQAWNDPHARIIVHVLAVVLATHANLDVFAFQPQQPVC
ncbi:UNVERIFIED_ORG: hypothetical protein ABIC77_001436 [Stenotrophomonas geniculata]